MNKTKIIKYPYRKTSNKERKKKKVKPVDVGKYKSLLGSVLYFSLKSQLDILYTINQVSKNCEHPTTIDYKTLLMILQYLKSTIHKSIYFKLVGFSDADYANDDFTRKSVKWIIFFFLLGNSPISWKFESLNLQMYEPLKSII